MMMRDKPEQLLSSWQIKDCGFWLFWIFFNDADIKIINHNLQIFKIILP